MKIEEILEKWLKKNYGEDYKYIVTNNMPILKEAFLAGYHQAIDDRKKIDGILTG